MCIRDSFKNGETEPWSWRQMLAALSPPVKNLVLGSNPSLGVVRITCEPVPGSYDHKRSHAARHLGRPYGPEAVVPVWDFFVTRTDGSTVRFHTNYRNNKVEVAKVSGGRATEELPKPPRKGPGKSDGPGTYRRQTQGNYDEIARSSQNNRGGGDGPAVPERPPGNFDVPGIYRRDNEGNSDQSACSPQNNRGGGVGPAAAEPPPGLQLGDITEPPPGLQHGEIERSEASWAWVAWDESGRGRQDQGVGSTETSRRMQ